MAPLVNFTVSLDAMPSSTNNDKFRDFAVDNLQWDAMLSLAVSTVWVMRQLRVEKKQHFAGDSR